MTTDNRTSEPTPEQIEAAAQAVREVDARAGLIADVDLPMYRARAALAAAAGAAPQAESEAGKRLSSEFRADLVEAARERIQAVWADVPEGVDAKTLAQNVVSAQEFFWLSLHFPVLPSSTVDEAALIREAKAEAWGEGYDEWAQAPAGDQPPRDNPYREGSET